MSQKPSGAYSSSKTWLSKINLTSGMRFFQGGLSFLLVFGQSLPPEVESAWANFGMKTVSDLKRVNAFNLKGRIPGKFFLWLRKMFYTSFFRVLFLHLTLFFVNCFFFFLQFCASASDKPGKVIVTVYSSTGRILGKTDFDYYDQDRETLLRLVKDPKLQSEFFCHWADFMVDKTKRGEGKDSSQPPAGTFLQLF